MKNRIVTIIFGICLALFIISFSIGMPILFRPFYYLQINKIIEISSSTSNNWDPSWTKEVIKQGYDEVLDFCTLVWVKDFSAGVFKFTEEGASHFADCKNLFILDFVIMGVSFTGCLTITILKRLNIVDFTTLLGRKVYFWTGASIISLFAIILIVVLCVGFDKSFEAFHSLFFPGKGNWLFDEKVDQIILVMPEEFFMNCAIFIISLLSSLCLASIGLDFIDFKKNKKA